MSETDKERQKSLGEKIMEYLPTVLVTLPAFGLIITHVFELSSGFCSQTANDYNLIYRIFTTVYFVLPPIFVFTLLYIRKENKIKAKQDSEVVEQLRSNLSNTTEPNNSGVTQNQPATTNVIVDGKKKTKGEDSKSWGYHGNLKPFYFAIWWLIALTITVFMYPNLFNHANQNYNQPVLIIAVLLLLGIYIFDIIINKSANEEYYGLVKKTFVFGGIIFLMLYSFNHSKRNTPTQFRPSIVADRSKSNTTSFDTQATAMGVYNEMKKCADTINKSLITSEDTFKDLDTIKNTFARTALGLVSKVSKDSSIIKEHESLVELYKAISKKAQIELQPVYQQTQWRGIFILSSLLLLLIGYRKNGLEIFSDVLVQKIDEKDSFLEGTRKNFSKIAKPAENFTVICVLLIVPLLLPIKEENIKVEDPAHAFKLHTWYLPSTIAYSFDYSINPIVQGGIIYGDSIHVDTFIDSVVNNNYPYKDIDTEGIKLLIKETDYRNLIRDDLIKNRIFEGMQILPTLKNDEGEKAIKNIKDSNWGKDTIYFLRLK